MGRAWWAGPGGQGLVGRAWWAGAWWVGPGGQGLVGRGWWAGPTAGPGYGRSVWGGRARRVPVVDFCSVLLYA